MADWFVDSSATGTGSGDTPANAALSVASLFARTTGGVIPGDNIWVRRTYTDPVSNQVLVWGANSAQITSQSAALQNHIIGWPSSCDPWFDVRPSTARSGQVPDWDQDALAKPMVWSGSSAPTAGTGVQPKVCTNIWNFSFVCSVGGKAPWFFASDLSGCMFNCETRFGLAAAALGNQLARYNQDHVTIQTSDANANRFIFNNPPQNFGKITVSSGTVFAGGLFNLLGTTWPIDVQHVHIETNSLFSLTADGTFAPTAYYMQHKFRKISGLKPVIEHLLVTPADPNNNYCRLYIDDWYGEGARILAQPSGIGMKQVSSANANFVGRVTNQFAVNSAGDADYIAGQGKLWHPWPEMSAIINVASGTPIAVRWQMYMVNFDNPARMPFKMAFLADVRSAHTSLAVSVGSRYIQPGDVGSWSGALVTAGSAYTFVHTITPLETGRIAVNLHVPMTIARSGYVLVCAQPEAF